MEKIKRFFSDPAAAGRRDRSRGGLVISILILPILLGVMGCFTLPVPIGNPEKSRIDPALTGAWIAEVDYGDAWVLVFEPFDKRTWLLTWLFLEEVPEEAATDGIAENNAAPPAEKEPDPQAATLANSSEDDAAPSAENEPDLEKATTVDSSDHKESALDLLIDGRFEIENVSIYKAWRTKIKAERFMTWEPKMVLSSERAMTPEYWWITRIRKLDDNELTLDYINPEFGDLEKVETRSQAEKIIRRHIKDPKLFMEVGGFPEIYARISQEDFDVLSDLLEEHKVVSDLMNK